MFLVPLNVISNLKERDIHPFKTDSKEDTLYRWRFFQLENWKELAYQTTWYMEGTSAEFASLGKC